MKKLYLLFFLLVVVFQSSSQDLDYLLTKMPFDSSIELLDTSGFSFTRNYSNSNSSWAIDSFSESTVFKSEMSYVNNIDTTKNYTIRIGKGGQLYSFKGSFGESVPPQWVHPNWVDSSYGGGTSYAPWVDEVWQMVCVDGAQHNAPDSMYFIHQAGVYLKTSSQIKPFFSPQVAEYFDSLNQSYTSVNWGQQAHTNTISNTGFTSSLLYYTKYTNLGEGVLQVDNMIYNFGNDNISFLNMPWGGVRNSTLEHFFISTPTNSYINSPGLYGQGPVVQTASTGGWVAWSNDTLGNSATLAMAHPKTTATNGNVFRYGDAGNLNASWNNRDYHVFEMIRFPSIGQLGFGSSMSFRYFYVLGKDIESVKNTIINNDLVFESLDTAYTPGINNVDSIRYSFVQQQGQINSIVDTTNSGLLLRTNPYVNSYPLFKICSYDSTDYISSDPYYLSHIAWDGVTKSISLLGFLNTPSNIKVINDTICISSNYTFSDGTIFTNITSDMSHISNFTSSLNGWDSLIVTNIYISCNISGCTDIISCNYDANANVDDGSCDLPNGCGDLLYLEFDASVTCSDANACITLIDNGCTDTTACNYDANANVDDGSCDLPNGCGDHLYLEFNASVTCSDANDCITLINNGCIDITACNYDANANVDDGSCDLPNGCGDHLYLEFDASVTCSDANACITLLVSWVNEENINDLSLYPNPSRDIFNITFISEKIQNFKIRVINLMGEDIINKNLKQFTGVYAEKIDLSNKAKGIYFLEIETNYGNINKKLILQ